MRTRRSNVGESLQSRNNFAASLASSECVECLRYCGACQTLSPVRGYPTDPRFLEFDPSRSSYSLISTYLRNFDSHTPVLKCGIVGEPPYQGLRDLARRPWFELRIEPVSPVSHSSERVIATICRLLAIHAAEPLSFLYDALRVTKLARVYTGGLAP